MKEKVLEILANAGQAMRPGDIVKQSGMEVWKKDIDKAIKELKLDEKIYSPKRCFYDIIK